MPKKSSKGIKKLLKMSNKPTKASLRAKLLKNRSKKRTTTLGPRKLETLKVVKKIKKKKKK